MSHPSPLTLHAVRHVGVRILTSPLTLWNQCRASRGGGSGESILPLYEEDSQAKHTKSRTLVSDLLIFMTSAAIIIFLLTSTMSSHHATPPIELSQPALSIDGIQANQHPPTRVQSIEAINEIEVEVNDAEGGGDNNDDDGIRTIPTTDDSLMAQLGTKLRNLVQGDSGKKASSNNAPSAPSSSSASGFREVSAAENRARRDAVRDAFRHAWSGYTEYAYGHDEVRPVTNTSHDSWGGFGATIVDGLDTAMLMGLTEEVERARTHVAKMSFERDFVASFFEITIRFLGGLLGAYELSRDDLYLAKARELADLLLPGFETSLKGIPKSKINLKLHTSQNQPWTGGQSILAEVGSIQLEFEYLSYHTRDERYRSVSRQVWKTLHEAPKDLHPGLYPTYLNPETGRFTNSQISFGSFGDSFYEYLLKLYILTDRSDQEALEMYLEAMEGLEKHLFQTRMVSYIDHQQTRTMTTADGGDDAGTVGVRKVEPFSFVGELSGRRLISKQEHLTCFLPGLLSLGASLVTNDMLQLENFPKWSNMQRGLETNRIMKHQHQHTKVQTNRDEEDEPTSFEPLPSLELTSNELRLQHEASKHIAMATSLLRTCIAAYTTTSTGLAPETIEFDFHTFNGVDPSLAGAERKAALAASAAASTAAVPIADDPSHPPNSGGHGILHVPSDGSLLGTLFRIDQSKYILRPETFESIFLQYRLTRDPYFREMGWKMFEHLRKSCQTRSGFTSIKDVNIGFGKGQFGTKKRPYHPEHHQEDRSELDDDDENWSNSQESFFFAETLKYLYLLFSDEDVLPLDRYVFNTEAHPLGIIVRHEDHQAPDESK